MLKVPRYQWEEGTQSKAVSHADLAGRHEVMAASGASGVAALQSVLDNAINTLTQIETMVTNFQTQAAPIKEGTHAMQEVDYTA
jgi:hypothetical protein